MASTARRGRRRADAIDVRPATAMRVVCYDGETPVAKMKTPHQNLRHEQHDVRREAPVVLVVHDQSPAIQPAWSDELPWPWAWYQNVPAGCVWGRWYT